MSNTSDFVIVTKENNTGNPNEVILTKYTGTDANVVIPEEVTKIGLGAFKIPITSITVPDSLEFVDASAFCDSGASLADKDGFCIVGCHLVRYVGNADVVHIPEYIRTITVGAFQGNETLKKLIIPDSVEVIGWRAFLDCRNLEEVLFTGDVQALRNIDAAAFSCCTKLHKINIPNSVASIESGAFYRCEGLRDSNSFLLVGRFLESYSGNDESVIVPEGVEIISSQAFKGNKLKNIVLPEGVKKIGRECFASCMQLESAILPESLTEIGAAAFSKCYELKNVTLPSGLKRIEGSLFEQCTALRSIQFPQSVEEIGPMAFCCCRNLREIAVPDSVKSIGFGAFEECKSLKKAALSDKMEKLEDNLFAGCTSLKEIVVPDSICAMGDQVFAGCEKIKAGYFSDRLGLSARTAEDKRWVSYLFCLAPEKHSPERAEEMLPYISRQKKWLLQEAIYNNDSIVAENLFKLGAAQPKHVLEAFESQVSYGKKQLSPKFEKVLESYTPAPKASKKKEPLPGVPLAEAKKMWTLAQDESGNYIIKGYKGTEEILEIPDVIAGKPVVAIAENAFDPYPYGKGRTESQRKVLLGVKAIHIPSTVAAIGEGAFSKVNLKLLELPEQVQTIGAAAFGVCRCLEKLMLPQNLKEIPERMCIGCAALKEVEIPASVQVIGKAAFERCGALTLVVCNDLAENYAKENCISYTRK